jgi:histidinol-phosphatase
VSEPDPGPHVDPQDALAWRDAAAGFADLADELTLAAFRGHLDVRVEQTLRSAVLERFPDHAVLGEESGHIGPEDAPTWVIDPIDGTTNFVKGNPVFATLIALQIDGEEVAGVVSAPALATRWDGVAGGPARQDGREIHVSDTDELGDAEVAFGGLDVFATEGRLALVADLSSRAGRVRGYGDFWQHCLVAAGSTDVAIEAEVKVWDLAAVKVVVEAAGGRFTDLAGRRRADGGSAVSSNGLLHAEVLAAARDTSP